MEKMKMVKAQETSLEIAARLDLSAKTVKELKTIAKQVGVKGYSSMTKFNLTVAIVAAEPNHVRCVKATEAVNKNIKEIVSLATINQFESALQKADIEIADKLTAIMSNSVEAVEAGVDGTLLYADNKTVPHRAISQSKKAFSKLDTFAMYQVSFGLESVKDKDFNDSKKLINEVKVQVTQENSILRAAGIELRNWADRNLYQYMQGCTDVLAVSIDKSLQGNSKKTREQLEMITSLFRSKTSKLGSRTNRSAFLVIKENGRAIFCSSLMKCGAHVDFNNGDIIKEYKFLSVTASGLTSKSFLGFAVRTYTSFNDSVNCDRRIAVLDSSIDGGMKKFYCNGEWVRMTSELEVFKGMTRIGLGQAPNIRLKDTMKNFIVFENMAQNVMFKDADGNIVSNENAFDGTVKVSAEYISANMPNGAEITPSQAEFLLLQVRGASLKSAGDITKKKHLVTLLLEKLNEKIDISHIVVDGVRYESIKEVRDAGMFSHLVQNLDAILDRNGLKLVEHKADFALTVLKQVKESDMNSGFFINAALMKTSPEKGAAIIREKGLKMLVKKFKEIGFVIKLNANSTGIASVKFDRELLNSPNNSSQVMEHILKSDSRSLQAMPCIISNVINNTLKSIANNIENLNLDLDWSKYVVVKPDEALLYGVQILNDKEIYLGMTQEEIDAEFDNGGYVLGTRHPISDVNAFIMYKVISKEEIAKRIAGLDKSYNVKAAILDNYMTCANVAVLPGSPMDMETHGGQDWDTDALQLIADAMIVALLGERDAKGSYISEEIADKASRMIKTNLENSVLRLQKEPLKINLKELLENNSFIEEEAPIKIDVTKSTVADDLMDGMVIEKTQEMEEAAFTCDFDSALEATYQYFTSIVSGIGELANTAMNNIMIRLFLVNDIVKNGLDNLSKESEAIVLAFNNYYKCDGEDRFVSNISSTERMVEASKARIEETILNFVKSDGSILSLVDFLEDVERYSRFVAETSIDASKNNYFIINVFKHNDIVQMMGCRSVTGFAPMSTVIEKDPTLTKEQQKEREEKMKTPNDLLFAEVVTSINNKVKTKYSNNNYFNIGLINAVNKNDEAINADEYIKCGGITITKDVADFDIEELATLIVADPIFEEKSIITAMANRAAVIMAKQVENFVWTDDSKLVRREINNSATAIKTSSQAAQNADRFIKAINSAYTTITLCVEDESEVEKISRKQFMSERAVNGLKNYASLALKDLDAVSIGNLVVDQLVSTCNLDTCGSVSSALYKVFEAEILAYLQVKGFENVGIANEKISNIRGKGSYDDIIGEEIAIIDGCGEVNGITVYTNSKKANIEGIIVNKDGKFFVEADRDVKIATDLDGMIIPMNHTKNIDLDNVDVFNLSKSIVSGRDKMFNVLTADGAYVGRLDINRDMFNMVSEIIEENNFTIFKTDKTAYQVMYINGEVLSSMKDQLFTKEEESFNNYHMGVEGDLEAAASNLVESGNKFSDEELSQFLIG